MWPFRRKKKAPNWMSAQLNEQIELLPPEVPGSARAAIAQRWIGQAVYFDGKAVKWQKVDNTLKWLSIGSGIVTTSFGGASAFGQGDSRSMNIAVAVAGGTTILVEAVRQHFKPAVIYQEARKCSEGIQREAWSFFQRIDDYRHLPQFTDDEQLDAFTLCGSRIEKINSQSLEERFADDLNSAELSERTMAARAAIPIQHSADRFSPPMSQREPSNNEIALYGTEEIGAQY